MLDAITPVILTYNEQANIDRTLSKLDWASDVVVVDSFSDDATLDRVARHPNARVFQRMFDDYERQWNYALDTTDIRTEWVLALDADYVLTDALIDEIAALDPAPDVMGYQASFTYCVSGRPLRGSLYPPVTVLFRRAGARYRQDGHTQRVVVPPLIGALRGRVMHDDRKPFRRWLVSQRRYAAQEAAVVRAAAWDELRWPDRIRKLRVVAPFAVLAYCLLIKRGLLDGWPGLVYAGQRCLAEVLLSSKLLREDFSLHTAVRTRSG